MGVWRGEFLPVIAGRRVYGLPVRFKGRSSVKGDRENRQRQDGWQEMTFQVCGKVADAPSRSGWFPFYRVCFLVGHSCGEGKVSWSVGFLAAGWVVGLPFVLLLSTAWGRNNKEGVFGICYFFLS